jgi:hypothetical protein
MIRTINDVMRSLLFQTSLPTRYWVESLHAATYLLNLLPTKTILAPSPHFALFDTTPSYAHLRVFGCACYRNTSATAPHKLAPCSCRCIFLGYSSEHKGYRCLDLTTNRLFVSRHVVFDESSFPFASSGTPLSNFDSLFPFSPTVPPIAPPYPSSVAGTSETVAGHARPRLLRPCHTRPRHPSCLWSYTTPYRGPLWSTVTTSTPSASPPTMFNTSTPSMLRLIFTLSVSALPSGTFVSSTSRRLLSSLSSSPMGCPPRCS